jgi:16S rRNA (guanine966-N2)-methyltransferase
VVPRKASGRYRSGVRIIGGRYKGRTIEVPDVEGLRPTSDRIRETLFNWLQPLITGADCLDLFAGSGVLSIEALSRGARSALAVERRRQCVDAVTKACAKLGVKGLEVRLEPAEKLLEHPCGAVYDVVFVDPPYELGMQGRICRMLEEFGWLSADAVVYVEAARGDEFEPPAGWAELKHKRAGNVAYMLFGARRG